MKNLLFFISLVVCLYNCNNQQNQLDYTQWSEYLGGSDRNQYSTLHQITPENVAQLKVAWTYDAPDSGQMQMSPIIADGKLFGVTAALQAFALNAATGKEIWRFGGLEKIWHSTSRGVSYWSNGEDKRILYTAGQYLYALNANTGQPILTFGDSGKVDLHIGLPLIAQHKFIVSNTPGTIFKNLIIMPVRLSEGADAAPGDVRAFDVRTGELVWTFHTIPHPEEFGYETWAADNYKNINVGGANNWAGMTVDNNLEILYVPTGSAAPDFYGGHRKGSNLFSDCLLALDANTGKLKWHFQFTHHDIWDRDLPAPPNLITVTRKGKKIPAVAQMTKQGYVFVFHRKTGKPLFDIEEVKVPASTLEGESAWATQPIPKLPKPFARQAQDFTEKDISPYAENRDELLEIFKASDKRLYAPPSTKPVFLLPGYDGGGEWGGAAADPEEGILYVNSNEMAWLLQMEKDTTVQNLSLGQALYIQNCASCHQKDLKGNQQSGYPNLVNISNTLKKKETLQLINTGKGMMPGYPHLTTVQKNAIANFLYHEEKQEAKGTATLKNIAPYRHTGYHKFLDSKGLPAISPPWGTLNAIDLNTGKYLWTVPLGETESLKAKGYPTTGTENYGGAVVTQNGLLFIAATKDGYFRVFDKKTGEMLREIKLPAAGFATPAIYQINGKQYIVIACGGEKLGTPKGNKVVAFALEDE